MSRVNGSTPLITKPNVGHQEIRPTRPSKDNKAPTTRCFIGFSSGDLANQVARATNNSPDRPAWQRDIDGKGAGTQDNCCCFFVGQITAASARETDSQERDAKLAGAVLDLQPLVSMKTKRPSSVPLPGFGVTMGLTLTYLSLVVLIPLFMLFVKAGGLNLSQFVAITTSPRVLASYRLSFLASLAAASADVCVGFLLAWVLVRYDFPGRRFIDSLVDLPFALPTAVAGIVLTTLYSPMGWLGRPLAALGLKVAFTPVGVALALSFVGFPFVVRTVQPVLQNLAAEDEEAAACLGANRFQIFVRLILPSVLPAVTTGFALAFARALGEYGSVVFISGNLPMRTEIPPLLIMTRLDQFDYHGAAAIAVVMLVASFIVLLLTHVLKWWGRRIGVWS